MAALLAKYNTALDLYFPLIKRGVMDYAVSADYTHASGDVKISKDGGAAATATNSPSAITMGNGGMWKLTLTATEMQAAQVVVTVIDTATKAIEDQMIIIQTYGNASALHPFDLGTASTPQTGDNYARIGTPAGASVSADIAAVKAETASIQSDTNDIQTRLPTALVSGRMDSNVQAMANGVVTAAVIATDAIDADALAADAIAEIADAVWDEDATGHQTQGTFGQAIGDPVADADTLWGLVNTNLNATISSRASQTSLDTLDDYVDTEVAAIKAKTDNLPASPAATSDIPTAAAVADQVWDEVLSGHLTGGSTGNALNSAGSAGDPWGTALPGAYGAGSAGYIVGNQLDAAVSSRASQTSLNTLDDYVDTEVAAIKAVTDAIGATGTGLSAIPWNAAWDAEVQSEAQDAIEANNLDHLVKIAVDTNFATTVHLDSVIGQLADNGTTATFDRTTDSLEALRDKEADIETDTQDIQGRLPAALVSGRMDSNVQAMATGVITATVIAADAIGASELAADAVAEIADAVWDEAVAGHLGAGSTGLALSNATAPTAAAVADAVWDEAISGHLGVGSTGEALNAAGAAGDPWTTTIPGAYGAGSAGYIVGTNVDAAISSRSTYAGGDTAGTTTLLSRLTATRAGYLDNLSAGAVATAAKLLKYVQLILRKDSAIATDNSAEVTEINANGGSGAGAYANTTDALEALRDRGDAAWTTASPPSAAAIRAEIDSNSTQLAKLGTPAGASMSADIAAVKAETASIQSDTNDIQGRLPAALVSGRMDSNTQAMADGVITALAIATDAIDADAIAANAVTEIQAGLSTYAGGDTSGVTTLLSRIPGTVQPQTGDSYARLGAPAGASVSADIAAVKAETASIQTDTNDVQTRLPAALTGAGNMKTDALAINGSTSAAAQLAKSAIGIVSGAAVTGTLSTTQMSTDLTEATNDHYAGLVLKWTSGALLGQATSISAYNGSTKVLTFTAVTEAPANGDTFVIM